MRLLLLKLHCLRIHTKQRCFSTKFTKYHFCNIWGEPKNKHLELKYGQCYDFVKNSSHQERMIWYSLIVPMVNERFKTATLYWTHPRKFPLFTYYYCCHIFFIVFLVIPWPSSSLPVTLFLQEVGGGRGRYDQIRCPPADGVLRCEHATFNGNLYSSAFTCS